MRQHFRILKIALLFHTIQNKSEKNIHAMIMYTCKSKLNLFFLEVWNHIYNCFNEILQIKFLQYIVVFLGRDVLNQFQLRGCNVYPSPPPNFSTDLAFFRECFFLRLGGRSPPLAPPLATPPDLAILTICIPDRDGPRVRIREKKSSRNFFGGKF